MANTEIAVYCSSSNHLDSSYYASAENLGLLLASKNLTLVYGGGNVGLMGVLAKTVHAHDGYVIGIIPDRLREAEGIAYDLADELIVTRSMSERKTKIWKRSDAFIVLAGGIGTLEEFLEVLTLKKLGYHNRPIALVNTNGVFDPLLKQLDMLDSNSFSSTLTHTLFDVVSTPSEVFELTSFRHFH